MTAARIALIDGEMLLADAAQLADVQHMHLVLNRAGQVVIAPRVLPDDVPVLQRHKPARPAKAAA